MSNVECCLIGLELWVAFLFFLIRSLTRYLIPLSLVFSVVLRVLICLSILDTVLLYYCNRSWSTSLPSTYTSWRCLASLSARDPTQHAQRRRGKSDLSVDPCWWVSHSTCTSLQTRGMLCRREADHSGVACWCIRCSGLTWSDLMLRLWCGTARAPQQNHLVKLSLKFLKIYENSRRKIYENCAPYADFPTKLIVLMIIATVWFWASSEIRVCC